MLRAKSIASTVQVSRREGWTESLIGAPHGGAAVCVALSEPLRSAAPTRCSFFCHTQ